MKLPNLSTLNRRFKQGAVDVKQRFEQATTSSREVVKETSYNFKVTTPQTYSYYSECYKNLPLNPKLVLFEAYQGTSFTGDLYALYTAMQKDERFADYEFVWTYSNDEIFNQLVANLSGVLNNTRFVSKSSKEYLELLATAGYYFNNEAAPLYYTKREGQIFTTVWRSTPFAYKGYDNGFDANNPYPIRNWLRSYLMSDYITSANEETTRILRRSYRLDGLYEGQILESGCPRFDIYHQMDTQNVKQKLENNGIIYSDDKPILTLHFSTDIKRGRENEDRFIQELTHYTEELKEQYNLLFLLPKSLRTMLIQENELFEAYCVPEWLDRTEILSISDVLVTDHSSVYYEFKPLHRPVYFYDFEEKTLDNHYVSMDEMEGTTCYTIIELVTELSKLELEAPTQLEISEVSSKYLDYIFFNQQPEGLSIKEAENGKKRLLFYAGNMKNNFITYRLFQVLNNLDFDKYDVSLLLPTNDLGSTSFDNLRKISTKVRPFFFQGYGLFTKEEDIQDKKIRKFGITPATQKDYPIMAYQRETRRTLATCHFDVAIDFQGNDFYWSRYIAESNSDYKVLMQQYNLSYQWNKAKKTRQKHRLESMNSLMTYYQKFDQIIHIKRNYEANMEFVKDYVAAEYVSYYQANDEEPTVKFPYYEAIQEPTLVEQSITRKVIPEDITAMEFYPNINDLSYSMVLDMSKAEQLTAVAKVMVDQTEYVKVLVDSLFFGWVNAETVNVETTHILETREVSYYAMIKKDKGHSIKAAPHNTTNDNYVVSASYYLSGIIVKVDEEVETLNNTYCRISIDDEVLGYVDRKALEEVKASERKVASNHLRNAERIEMRILRSEAYEAKATLKQPSETVLYKKSYGSYRCEPLEMTGEQLAPRPLRITWRVETKSGVSYEALDDFNQHSWIREEDLNFLN